MEMALAVEYMQMHQRAVHTQPAQQEEVEIKPVHISAAVTQPVQGAQGVPVDQQIPAAVTQPVQRAQGSVDVHIPAAVTQPVQRAQGVPALPCELVRGGGRKTTSPQEPDNYRQAQSKQRDVSSS